MKRCYDSPDAFDGWIKQLYLVYEEWGRFRSCSLCAISLPGIRVYPTDHSLAWNGLPMLEKGGTWGHFLHVSWLKQVRFPHPKRPKFELLISCSLLILSFSRFSIISSSSTLVQA